MTTPPSRHPRLMQRLVAALAALTCAVLTLTSCRSDTAAPTTPPTTHVSTQAAPTSGASTASASPSPVDEAIAAYKQYQAATADAYRSGGGKLSADLRNLTTGPERKVVAVFMSEAKKEGLKIVDGDIVVRDAKATKASGTRVTVQACLDFHTVVLEDRKGRRGPAMDYATDRADLRLGKDGRWRVYETLQTQADSC